MKNFLCKISTCAEAWKSGAVKIRASGDEVLHMRMIKIIVRVIYVTGVIMVLCTKVAA